MIELSNIIHSSHSLKSNDPFSGNPFYARLVYLIGGVDKLYIRECLRMVPIQRDVHLSDNIKLCEVIARINDHDKSI